MREKNIQNTVEYRKGEGGWGGYNKAECEGKKKKKKNK